MDYNVTVLAEKAFCVVRIDDTAFIAISQPVKTHDDNMILFTISEIGSSPVIYELFSKNFFDPKRILPEMLDYYFTQEYRLVHFVDRSMPENVVHIDAYKSKRFSDNRVRTMPFQIDDEKDYTYTAELFKVYDDEDDQTHYRFVVYDQDYHLRVVEATYSVADEEVGLLFEALLKELIKVVRIARARSKPLMDIWDSDKWHIA